MSDALIVFMKAPRPGTVKTRLAAALGPERAGAVYRRLAEIEVRATAPLRDEYEQVLFYAPADGEAEMRAWMGDARLLPQQEGDLGARMSDAFALVFAEGARRAAIVGTDVPWVRRAHVRDALDALDDHDLAIGPAHDGGYYLLALGRPRPELFTGIAWSSPDVLERTLDRAAALHLSVRTLETLADVDTAEDVVREWARLRPLLGAPLGRAVASALDLPDD